MFMVLDDVEIVSYDRMLQSRLIKVIHKEQLQAYTVLFIMQDGPWYGINITDKLLNDTFCNYRDYRKADEMKKFRSKFIENSIWFKTKLELVEYVESGKWNAGYIHAQVLINELIKRVTNAVR